MTTFDTPNPITAAIHIGIGDIAVTAGDRADTVVTVSPRDTANARDVQAARDATVDFTGTALTVRAKTWRRFTPNSDGAVRVSVEMPTGSSLEAETGMGAIRGTGALGRTVARTGMGEVDLEHTGRLHARSGMGDVRVGTVDGDAKASTGSGSITLGVVTGTISATTSTGDVTVESAGGDAEVHTASGALTVRHAATSVHARSAAGAIHLGDVATGSIRARTAAGSVDIGVREGSAAWMDLTTQFGTVRNSLAEVVGPEEGDARVKIQVRTAAGDITVRRTPSSTSEAA